MGFRVCEADEARDCRDKGSRLDLKDNIGSVVVEVPNVDKNEWNQNECPRARWGHAMSAGGMTRAP